MHGPVNIAASLFLLCSSCGTSQTRAREPFGAYPFQAVAYDIHMMARWQGGEVMGMGAGPLWFFMGGLISIPVDLLFDSIGFPADVAFWIAGREKRWSK